MPDRGARTDLRKPLRWGALLPILVAFTCVAATIELGLMYFLAGGDCFDLPQCRTTHKILSLVAVGSMPIALILYIWAVVAISRTWLRRSQTRYRFGSPR
jgi:hypothetical protein